MRSLTEGGLLLLALLALGVSTADGAPKPVVQWQIKAAPAKPVKAGAKFTVSITGHIDPGWHLYALEEPPGGPVATEVALTDGDPADLLRVEEAKPHVLPDPVFQKPTKFFEGSAGFTLYLQAARETAPGPGTLRVLVRYQSCNDRVCLPPHTDTIPVELTLAQ
ncbi:Cytochrome c-type biogenesis protein DsbD, protein-disulfide reductase [Acidisarcina polymorpha]|uniref:Cytochrome c-type biogenesis protein DsbD, protein-disulfide reductase n=1 Tax=Acidisarcina polymorpha TaxID=2211140 RepID=A0A2Z5FXH1_9BACT|nr:protein-disulfide reductase DsbD domain-containing protein [Acidisarcina polymorpha]AXC11573.1 Cytochrome c-type biogenesis protein DsbD, protein-disulfide reductase [Acidisarcina polymorpha]